MSGRLNAREVPAGAPGAPCYGSTSQMNAGNTTRVPHGAEGPTKRTDVSDPPVFGRAELAFARRLEGMPGVTRHFTHPELDDTAEAPAVRSRAWAALLTGSN
jgi:hypothetical protein